MCNRFIQNATGNMVENDVYGKYVTLFRINGIKFRLQRRENRKAREQSKRREEVNKSL